ncbi:multidrug effflux MFS transporter [Parathalassolituus penaei]|uniref:Bcr/CflA family efflux transporter n=1 Tax=Parathalassolituus penaei TaxID=2997323 RepID=A0A9X3EGG6_9GAMM|nr:multidrug effflux MFS transporter [Parathalassolituus penaei]MCY0966295.1 multidrug effflux MFS transporter [Parathalassolituus penaei]
MNAPIARPTTGLLLMLSALTALTPLATDVYLAAVPVMAEAFGRSLHDIELSISFYLLGFSIGQLLGGPLSDRYGRRRMVLFGLSVFAFGTLMILLSPTLELLWGARVLQALGGGLAVVNTGAIIRDMATGREGAGYMVRVVQVMMIAPLAAPILGMLILKISNWQMIFVFLLLYAAVLIALFRQHLPETSQYRVRGNLFRNYGIVLGERRVWGFIASTCAAYAGLLSFITASPSVYMGYFGISEGAYPFVFGGNVLCMVAMSRVNLKLLKRYNPSQLVSFGQAVQLSMGVLMVLYALLAEHMQLMPLMLMIMAFMGCHGFIVANSTSSTTEFFPQQAGTATALIGALGFASGGLAGAVVSATSDGTPLSMVAMMAGGCLLGITLRFINSRTRPPVSSGD